MYQETVVLYQSAVPPHPSWHVVYPTGSAPLVPRVGDHVESRGMRPVLKVTWSMKPTRPGHAFVAVELGAPE
ncbi:hypothetical protein QLT00_gp60 [Gordonia phage Commandaria]|uniref:Uncharacterized protein n=1 Tax=Gordonia phage Commandaria TaxID=3038364 RepID=A0AAF0K145_9CAUD|nr:hypothetical protein QLT00_gp60 [Gordonia phage Commandaria]WGH20843.1 hypothetical protein [Gordonia phage Commandaria]